MPAVDPRYLALLEEGEMNMCIKVSALLTTLMVSLPAMGQAQGELTSATDITREQVQTVLEGMGESIDRQLKVVDVGAGNVAVGILHRDSDNDTDGEHRGLIHMHISETYVVLEGGGTLLTGGEIVNPGEPSEGGIVIGPSFSAESRNGQVREISAGDIVVIPAGVLHSWLEIPDEVTYLSIRGDPDRVLPAGFVNPEIN